MKGCAPESAPYPSAKREGHYAPSPYVVRSSGGVQKGQGREAGEAFTLELSEPLRYSAAGCRASFVVPYRVYCHKYVGLRWKRSNLLPG